MTATPLGIVLRHLRQLVHADTRAEQPDRRLLERFLSERDEAAFSALLQRHGPLVLGVCRRVLGDIHEAEDAFQATFLVLARRAAAVRKQDSLGSWLHGVAYRVALKAQVDLARRRQCEREHAGTTSPGPVEQASLRELCAVVDEELARMPPRFRAPLLLCYLQGMTREEAARELGWTAGMVKGRLERGRDLLRSRLVRRGLTLSGGLLATMLAQETSAAVPALLTSTTVQGIVGALAGRTAALSTRVLALAEGVIYAMTLARLKSAAAVAVALLLLSTGAGLLAQRRGDEPAPPEPAPASVAASPPTPADAQGDPLPHDVLARMGSLRLRHGGIVQCEAFSPDGKVLASGSWDGSVRLWDTATGKELRRWDDCHPCVYSLSFSPDGATLSALVAFLPGNRVRTWDVSTGKELRHVDSYTVNTRCIGQDPDGQGLLAASTTANDEDTAIRLLDVGTQKEVGQLIGHKEKILFVAFSPDGKTVVSFSSDNTLRLWDVKGRKELRRLTVPIKERGQVVSAAFSPDGKTLALGLTDNSLRLWDAATGKERQNLWNRTYVMSLAFTPDGKTLAAGAEDHTITLWDTATGKEIRPFGGHEQPLLTLAVAPDGRTLATSSKDSTVRLWDTTAGKELFRLEGQEYVHALAFAPDGKTLAVGGSLLDHRLRLLDAATGKEQRLLAGHEASVTSVAFAPDGKLLASASDDSTVRLWDPAAGKEVRRLELRGRVLSVAFSPDGRQLATTSWDEAGDPSGGKQVRLWDAAAGKEQRDLFLGFSGTVEAVAFAPDNRTLAVCLSDNTIRIRDRATGQELGRINRDPDGKELLPENDRNHGQNVIIGSDIRRHALAVVFSPDGKTLAGAEANNRILVYEVATGRVRRELPDHQAAVRALAFAADGRFLASASMDHTAQLWDVTRCARHWRQDVAKHTPATLEAYWAGLAVNDRNGGELILWSLRHAPRQTVAYVKEHLQPIPRADTARLERLILDLNADDFAIREKATTELEKLEKVAEPALRQALKKSPTAETRKRVEAILQKLESPTASGDWLRALRAIELLEYFGTPEAREHLSTLAEGAPEARLTREAQRSLERLRGR